MKTLITTVGCALVCSQPALAAHREPDLESKLPVAHPVYCPDSDEEWANDPRGSGSAAYTFISGSHAGDIHLSPTTCTNLKSPQFQYSFADSAQTLYHEWFHAQFLIAREGEVECLGLYIFKYAMRHWWGKTLQESQTLYNYAWSEHLKLARSVPLYRGVCTKASAVDPIP